MSGPIARLQAFVLVAMFAWLAAASQAEAFRRPEGPASLIVQASQSIDPCYKSCVIDRVWRNAVRGCMSWCNARPRKVCQDRCYRAEPNRPIQRQNCLKRC
jgi:hypothetical protein